MSLCSHSSWRLWHPSPCGQEGYAWGRIQGQGESRGLGRGGVAQTDSLGKDEGSCAHHPSVEALLCSQMEAAVFVAFTLRAISGWHSRPTGTPWCHLRQRMKGKEDTDLPGQRKGEGEPHTLADCFSVSLTAQKAKGDMKRKGRLEPYAYIPLNRTKFNCRYGVRGWLGWWH